MVYLSGINEARSTDEKKVDRNSLVIRALLVKHRTGRVLTLLSGISSKWLLDKSAIESPEGSVKRCMLDNGTSYK